MKNGTFTAMPYAILAAMVFIFLIPISYFFGTYDKVGPLSKNTFYDNWE